MNGPSTPPCEPTEGAGSPAAAVSPDAVSPEAVSPETVSLETVPPGTVPPGTATDGAATRRSTVDLGRRGFLLAGAAVALAACGGGGSGSDDGAGACDVDGLPTDTDDDLSAVRFFGPYFGAGAVARVPFGLSDSTGLLPVDEIPEQVTVSVFDPDGVVVASCLEVPRPHEGMPRPYFAFEVTPEVPGFYDLAIDVDGRSVISQFQVIERDAPVMTTLVGPGDRFPSVATPTLDDARGVDPICTRQPACDLHGASLDTVLGTAPVALLVATPAFCSTVVCGPVLDVMLGLIPDHPGITFVHAEVFTAPADNSVPPVPEDFAPIINAAGLPFEPALFTIGADGIVVDRLDYIFAAEEMDDRLRRLTG